MRKKKHGCHTGDAGIPRFGESKNSRQGDDDHTDAGPESIRDPHRHIFAHDRQQLKGQNVPDDA